MESQYFSDYVNGNPKRGVWEKLNVDGGGAPDLFAHNKGLFDEDQFADGTQIDAVDGNPVDNSTFRATEDLTISDSLEAAGEAELEEWELLGLDAETRAAILRDKQLDADTDDWIRGREIELAENARLEDVHDIDAVAWRPQTIYLDLLDASGVFRYILKC